MGRLRYNDIEATVNAARGVHKYCTRLAARTSMLVSEAKKIPRELRSEIGNPGDTYGFEISRQWVQAEGGGATGRAVVNPLIVAELRDGPGNPLAALNSARTAARTLQQYIHDNVSTLAAEHTNATTDEEVPQTLPQANLDQIKTLAAVVPPLLADFLE